MGLSSNQARFLSLTSRQIDMEQRIQQICQRRLRLSSELENVATQYNRAISNRKMFTPSLSGLNALSVDTLSQLGFKVINTDTQKIVGTRPPSGSPPPNQIAITSQDQFLNIVNQMNSSGVGLDKNYILECDIDLSGYDTGGKALIQGDFTGNFDGNCYQIKNLNIVNTTASTVPDDSYYGCDSTSSGVGMFERISGGSVSNIELADVNISVNGNVYRAGALAGVVTNGGKVSNVNVSDTTISGSTDSKGLGGLVGYMDGSASAISECTVDANLSGAWSLGGVVGLMNGGLLEKTESLGSINVNQASMRVKDTHYTDRMAGGIAGAVQGGTVSQCYSEVDISNIQSYSGGIAGMISGSGVVVKDSYSIGNIQGNSTVGGVAGDIRDNANVTNCYTQTTLSSSGLVGGFYSARGAGAAATVSNSFYDNTLYTGGFGSNGDIAYWTNVGGVPATDITNHTGSFNTITSSWDKTNIWDFSSGAPTLRNTGYNAYGTDVEENLRSGKYSLLREADEFTQSPLTINGIQYEEVDWRTMPQIYDELYKGDDVEAEDKYDKIIAEINAQDKKLQLEQTAVETEYKAVTSEREAVKKILDTNAQNSFKYFS